jgi:hypothetical protein
MKKSSYSVTILFSILLLLIGSCSESKREVEEFKPEEENLLESRPLAQDTLFNEPNLSTDYSDIRVFIGELQEKEGDYYVTVKVETDRENYHIEMVGNLTDEKETERGATMVSEHTYEFEKIPGFRPNLILLSIYNPIDGNWNDLKFRFF